MEKQQQQQHIIVSYLSPHKMASKFLESVPLHLMRKSRKHTNDWQGRNDKEWDDKIWMSQSYVHHGDLFYQDWIKAQQKIFNPPTGHRIKRHVLVDGKVRTDKTYPAGFMDVVSIPKTNENFRLLYDTKGRFRLHSVRDDEAKFKLCKVRSVQFGQKGIPYLNTYDGRTIRYPDPLIRANDTIKLDLEENKIVDFIKFDVGNVVMVTGGRNRGRVGVIKNREKHKGSFETIHVQDATGHEFATRMGNVFTIGKGTKPWISLPKGKGIKLSIIEEARKRIAAQQATAA
ncbi:hypothetical protein JHK86_003202 [Glycine max]|nr:hypothetical protein JHK86_003202 [Glycine max]